MISHVVAVDEAVVVEAVVAGLGWAAVLLGAYLAASVAASLLVHGLRLGRRAAGVVDAVTLPPLRRLVQAVVGTGLAAGALVASAPAGASSDAPVPVMRRLEDDAPQAPARTATPEPPPPSTPAMATATGPASPPATATAPPPPTTASPTPMPPPVRPAAAPAPTPTTAPAAAAAPPTATDTASAHTTAPNAVATSPPPATASASAHTTAPAPPPPASPAPEWTVRPGDHFWHIAENVLTERLQRAPSDGETDPYWRRLVAANRDRLADPGNPDLLFPGQVVLLPAS